ncbi:DUF7882 family protein [Microbacterium trichothecenolyticum]|uniref:DUF7882 domain-containing protein n=1 Tax=Microbacterium trichothecenolyticum TaxID=69370 RepID=A0ABU0TT68_MICTR|nr:hypothetical protein [Microbacterium trichothecenolyticum]MDQ1122862.1 hypothetical protein [Microbacterium trichothecenolyticum]
MGQLFYGTSTESVRIPDRLLSHIKVVVTTKLRRGESFTLNWTHVDGTPGRSTLWLQPAIAMRFVFDTAEPETLNATVLKTMAETANSASGLVVDLAAEIPAHETAPRTAAVRRTTTTTRRPSLSVAA